MSFRATKKNKNNSYLEIDLKELFGDNVPDSTKFRQAVGQKVIDIITDRTDDNRYLTNAKLEYSPEYASSLAFNAFGKKKNDVNLTQSGNMLGLMDVIKESKDKIRIGWTDPLERKKATNHNFGISEGLPKREFLGLTKDEVKEIRDEFKPEVKQVKEDEISRSSVDNLQRFIRGQLDLPAAPDPDTAFTRLVTAAVADEDLDEDLF